MEDRREGDGMINLINGDKFYGYWVKGKLEGRARL